MKEQDLHIGCTYLLCLEGEKPSTIKDRADLSAAFDYFSTGHLKGIPLTGDVLVDNLGLEKSNMFNNYFSLWNENDNFPCLNLSLHFDGCEIKVKGFNVLIKYVHQLQILYFSLTGEFLPYKQ